MEKIKKEEIKMKPKWYFVLGSVLMTTGLISATIFTVLSFNLIFFLLRKHYGPMYHYRLQFILNNFPWWLLIPSIFGLILGLRLLKEYRFSYKNNFWLVFSGYILIILISAFLIDFFNFNNFFNRPQWRRFYFKENLKDNLKNQPFKNGFRKGRGF